MSDYMFMLENHLTAGQNRAVAAVQHAAVQAQVQLFLTGGAMRDMLGGFPIRDLDFTVEGNALKIARMVAEEANARIVLQDETRKFAELVFPGGETAQIAAARQEKYARTGSKPQVSAASIQDDLRRRDFSINAIALSLNRASLGLLLDPANGLADLSGRELRALSNYSFYNDPVRILRMVRLRVRLGFAIAERTQQQYENAKLEEVEKLIPPQALLEELHAIANEPAPSELLRALEKEGLLAVFSPALAGPKLNWVALGKLDKASRLLDGTLGVDRFAPFLHVLTEKMSPKETAALIKTTGMGKEDVESWQKLEARTKKLEQLLKSDRLKKPSSVYQALSGALPDEILYLLYHSAHRTTHDRIKNYLQKYLPAVQEITAAELAAVEGTPGTPKYEKAKEAFINKRLDRRPKPVEAPPPPPPEPPPRARGRSL